MYMSSTLLAIIALCFMVMAIQIAAQPHHHHDHNHDHDHPNHHHNHEHPEHHHHHHHHHHNHEHDHDPEHADKQQHNAQDNDISSDPEIANRLGDENDADEFCVWNKCAKVLSEPRGIGKYFDFNFLKKLARNLNPFGTTRLIMNFYLFKRDFPDCGRELKLNTESILKSGLDPLHPTRIIIHGWMSQSRGSFNRDVKNAYLSRADYNIIVADWSSNAANLNYFSVVKMIEDFGAQLAEFTTHLHNTMGVSYDDIYLIGHSLGAQIAGAAGKRVKPNQYNTIFALDPAGPTFRHRSIECRIDPTDAKYVESIQTSANLGFLEPTGNATFYPNYGIRQKSCYMIGCSHIRAYKMFAESITSALGFWGTPCRKNMSNFDCDKNSNGLFQMGGEPSQLKSGIYYVDTADSEPFALGRVANDSKR